MYIISPYFEVVAMAALIREVRFLRTTEVDHLPEVNATKECLPPYCFGQEKGNTTTTNNRWNNNGKAACPHMEGIREEEVKSPYSDQYWVPHGNLAQHHRVNFGQ